MLSAHLTRAPRLPPLRCLQARCHASLPSFIFPYTDSFELDKGRHVDSTTVTALLSEHISTERLQRIDSVLNARTYNVIPLVEGVFDVGNLAAVCRSADAFGFGAVHCVLNSKYKQSQRSAAGADKWLDVKVWTNTEEALSSLKGAGFQIVVTHLSSTSVPIQDVDFTRPTVFVLGNEKHGVSAAAVAAADATAVVPMAGFVESFNISVAGALIMYEAARQRAVKLGRGVGDLGEAERKLLKAAWLLRGVRNSRTLAAQLLDRPPAPHQARTFRRFARFMEDAGAASDRKGEAGEGAAGDGVDAGTGAAATAA